MNLESKNYKKLGLASETIPKNHLNDLANWIQSYPRLTQGQKTDEFETVFANFINTKYSTFVNSGSSANLLIATSNLYFDKLRNKKVGVPALSWSTTVSPFINLGYEPFLIDSDISNLGISVDHLYKIIKQEDISTLIIVHVLGHDSSIEKIVDICDEYNIRLFEDCCQSLGSITNKKKIGSFGLASSFSFFYGHHISTIEGGSVCSSDNEFIQICRSIRSHGWGRNLDTNFLSKLKEKNKISKFRDLYTFYYPGYNIRSTDLNAYLGLLQMEILEEYCFKRSIIFNQYKIELSDFWCQQSSTDFISSFAFATFVENPNEVWDYLKLRNIESRPLIAGSIGQQPFWKDFSGEITSLGFADFIHLYGIYLPVHADLTPDDVKRISATFREVARPISFNG